MDRKPISREIPTEMADFFALDRHVLCPNYSTCLDEAVLRNQYSDCGECAFKINGIKTCPVMHGSSGPWSSEKFRMKPTPPARR